MKAVSDAQRNNQYTLSNLYLFSDLQMKLLEPEIGQVSALGIACVNNVNYE